MSALGTDEQTKDLVPYYHAKWEMEQTVKASGLEHVIFRPSFVFGRGGGALHQFSRIAKVAPVTPIIGPGTQRIQPIWVDDVAAYFVAGVERPEAANRTFELGGPDVVTWNEFWSRLKQALGARRPSRPPAVRPDARRRRRCSRSCRSRPSPATSWRCSRPATTSSRTRTRSTPSASRSSRSTSSCAAGYARREA